MKNRITVRHGMLRDLKAYLMQSGWILEQLVGQYEVLRARRKGYPRPSSYMTGHLEAVGTALMRET